MASFVRAISCRSSQVSCLRSWKVSCPSSANKSIGETLAMTNTALVETVLYAEIYFYRPTLCPLASPVLYLGPGSWSLWHTRVTGRPSPSKSVFLTGEGLLYSHPSPGFLGYLPEMPNVVSGKSPFFSWWVGIPFSSGFSPRFSSNTREC